MKKVLMTILCASILSPSLVFAKNVVEKRSNDTSSKSIQVAQNKNNNSKNDNNKNNNSKNDNNKNNNSKNDNNKNDKNGDDGR